MEKYKFCFPTPLGKMQAILSEKGICSLEFIDQVEDMQPDCELKTELKAFADQLVRELTEYFEGKRKKFSLPLDMSGTDFQRTVWYSLLEIPFGKTCSYLQLATAISNKKAVRAVAKANGDNCLAILVPCHRVIGGDGNLTGYRWGLHRKKQIIDLERRWSGKDVQMEIEL